MKSTKSFAGLALCSTFVHQTSRVQKLYIGRTTSDTVYISASVLWVFILESSYIALWLEKSTDNRLETQDAESALSIYCWINQRKWKSRVASRHTRHLKSARPVYAVVCRPTQPRGALAQTESSTSTADSRMHATACVSVTHTAAHSFTSTCWEMVGRLRVYSV